MKIYSWNVLFRNKEFDRAFDFIARSDFDVFCLQEVPEEFLERLKRLSCRLVYTIDVVRLFPERSRTNYVVILSKYSIVGMGTVSFPDYWPELPVHTRIAVSLLRPLGFTKIRDRGAVYADLAQGDAVVRVFCLHLILSSPTRRMKEFETALAEKLPGRPAIVCGDFNTIESRFWAFTNWLMGGKVSDVLLHKRERTHIEKRFVEHELRNPLRGSITHPITASQLDHILVSHSFTIKNVEVIRDTYGSDHCPIFVETA